MRLLSLLAVVGVFFGAVSAHGDHGHTHDHDGEDTASGDSSVVKLDSSNFDSFIGENELSLVEFFAPWCGHCKQLAPQYEIAAAQLVGTAALGAVDCTVEKDLCGKFDVKGFPTLKVFRKGSDKPSEYGGGRQSDDIVKFMRKQNAPAYVVVPQSEIDSLVQRDGVVVVGYFPSADDSNAKSFIETAKGLRNDYTFAIVTDAVDGVAQPTVKLYKSGEVETFDGTDYTTDALQPFVVANAFPLVGEIGPENFQKYVERGFPLVWIFLDYNADATKNILDIATNVAKDFKGRLSVVKLDGIRWAEHSKNFGLSGTPPGIVIEDRNTNKNYVFPQANEITEDALRTHLQGFVDGTLQPTVKSEEIPEKQDGPVYVLVGKNFESIVMDETKDVLVEFYAPWCGHCKTLAPKYDALGESFKSNPNVIIAKIDATANDTPVDIQGFPTIIYWPANNKKSPITYEGERTESALAAFVRENGSTFGTDATTESASDDTKHDEL